MCLYPCSAWFVFMFLSISLIYQVEGRKHSRFRARENNEAVHRPAHRKTEHYRRAQVSDKSYEAPKSKEANYRRSMKRLNETEEKDSDLLTRKAEDILLDEIKGSDQAANRAEIGYDIPKQMAYLKSAMKEGDITDIDTANMIDLNEKKGTYLPMSEIKATVRDGPKDRLLTDQFKNISGLPEFMIKKSPKLRKGKSASLVERVAQTLQPSVSAFSGIKQLLEESKVEQSLKKHLDNMNTNLINSIANPPVHNGPSVVDTVDSAASLNTLNIANEPSFNPAYVTQINPDQMYDEAISPPEQLLDDLSAGKFKQPMSDNALERMSDWNANKEFLADNGFGNSNEGMITPKLTRVASDIMPVRDVYLKSKALRPTEAISKDTLEFLKKDPEVLGRNQELLNSHQFNSLTDLDSIGPPIYPSKVVHLPHVAKHIMMPPKHVVTHVRGTDFHNDVNEGYGFHDDHFPMDEDDDFSDHMYHPHRPEYSARCSYKPCLNGGKCTALVDRYVCTCREGFMGINCERRSYCYPTPCKHGTCSSNTDGFICTCEIGYQGKRCEEKDKCHPSPCMHGGTCSSTFSGIYCSCLPGFKGRYCETEAKCSPINPCLNGGRCQELPSMYICICKNGFAGRNCDAILKPTSLPPTLEPKPVPPQSIPVPAHGQPPFLLEELNSLNDGPLEEHPMPETKIDAVPLDDYHGHKVYEEHHFPDIFDDDDASHHHDHHDFHDHDEPQLAISSSPAVILHLGDRTKDKKKEPVKDNGKKKKRPPTDIKQDDRYVTHLVAAAPMNGKPVNEDKKPAEEKKPPMEKPTAKQDKPKERIPTAQTLMRLQNPQDLQLDDNRVYTDTTGMLANGGLDQIAAHANQGPLSHGPEMYARPAVKHVVLKDNKAKLKKLQPAKPGVQAKVKNQQKPRIVWAKPNGQQKQRGPVLKQKPKAKAIVKKPSTMCPGFCKLFCDTWCVNVGCCKRAEIEGPTEAGNLVSGGQRKVVAKKGPKHGPPSAGSGSKCQECSENADCVKGRCKCKEGFVGNGKDCKVNPCTYCDDNATCDRGTCACTVGYFGDGIRCTRFNDHCARCSPYADCVGNFCLCKPGYYGNGNDCWPNTDPLL